MCLLISVTSFLNYLSTDCDGRDVDIYFALDSSSSIWPEDFKKQNKFVNDLIDRFDFKRNKTRVGVLVYSTRIHPKVTLDSRWSKVNIQRAVESINYTSGLTNTADAIKFIRQYGFNQRNSRPNARKLAIILTGGISRDPTATKRESMLSTVDKQT